MKLTDDELAVLEEFRPRPRSDGSEMRLPHVLTDSSRQVIAERLVSIGLLDRRRQSRKGFPPLYVITDDGVATLPADAPPRPPLPDLIY